MIIGFDVYRDKNKRKKSVGGFVASLNESFSSWFNKVFFGHFWGTCSQLNLTACLITFR